MERYDQSDELIGRWLKDAADPRLPQRVLDATFERTRKSRQQIAWRAMPWRTWIPRSIPALGGAAVLVIAVVLTANLVVDHRAAVGPQPTAGPTADPRSPFLGTWISTSDADGGTQTMTVSPSAGGGVEIVVTDSIATVCSKTPSTMRGAARIDGTTKLVIAAPVFTCDDGSAPTVPSDDPPLDEQLHNLTYVHDPESDILTVGVGSVSVWHRPGTVGVDQLTGLSDDQLWEPSRFEGTWASAAADTGFIGTWESTDVDGSSLVLGVRAAKASSDTFEVLLLDDRAGGSRRRWPESDWNGPLCATGSGTSGPITMTGTGRAEGPALAIGSQTWICTDESGPHFVTGDRSIELSGGYAPLVHDPETDTLAGPANVVWHRRAPGTDPLAIPFWGVWPQSNLQDAGQAQQRADAGDPASTWQLSPELATPMQSVIVPVPVQDPVDGAEILTRFRRDVLRLGQVHDGLQARSDAGVLPSRMDVRVDPVRPRNERHVPEGRARRGLPADDRRHQV